MTSKRPPMRYKKKKPGEVHPDKRLDLWGGVIGTETALDNARSHVRGFITHYQWVMAGGGTLHRKGSKAEAKLEPSPDLIRHSEELLAQMDGVLVDFQRMRDEIKGLEH